MRIDRVETFRVRPRWLFLRLETDDGVVGWGEPVVEGRRGPSRPQFTNSPTWSSALTHCAERTRGRY